MVIDKLKAKGSFVLLVLDEAEEKRYGMVIPDSAKQKPQTGLIKSVGKLVQDKSIVVGEKAYFHKTAGFSLEIEGEDVYVLREQDIICGS